MRLTADYHTHTVFSHGKGKIIDNAISAKEQGLKEVGISDHGFSHPAFGLTKRKVPKMRTLVDEASKQTGVKVLLGIESNIIGTDGKVDLSPKYYDYFDIFLAGIHKFVLYKLDSIFPLAVPDLYHTYLKSKNIPKSVINTNTKTFINVIKNNPVDVITHLNFCCFADAYEVAKAAADYGTYIELNAKKVHFTDDEIEKMLKTDVKFIVNSDAHSPNRVGEISLVENMIKRLNFPTERIVNIDGRLPKMRFKSFKEDKR
jgi:putative hydrolase